MEPQITIVGAVWCQPCKILKEEMFLKELTIGKKYIFHGLINKQMNKRRGAWIVVCHFVTMVVPWVI